MRAFPFALAALVLAGCPLPQPLPVVGRTDGTSVAPPIVLADTVQPDETIVLLRPDCPPGTVQPFSAVLDDPNLEDVVIARWFVDYDAKRGSVGIVREDRPPPATDGVDTRRVLLPFDFEPAPFLASGAHHVVELVVSNGFYPQGTAGLDLPNRTAQPGFGTQVYRWFVVFDAAGTCPGG